jgi:hypothetical protein
MIRLIFILLIGHSFAQSTFYLKPTISFKGQFTSSTPTSFESSVFNSNNYFSYENRTVILPKKFSPLLVGLSLGIKVKSDFLIEIGINQDESVCGAKINFNNYESISGTYTDSKIKYFKGNSFGRYYIQSSFLLDKINQNNKLFFDFGLGLAFRVGGISTEKSQFDEYSVLLDENYSILEINSYVGKNQYKSFLFNFGLTDDISIQGKYIGSISLFYSKSKSILNTVISEITVNSNIENKTYNFGSFSRGSGVYLQFSRKIQVIPWKGKKIKSS